MMMIVECCNPFPLISRVLHPFSHILLGYCCLPQVLTLPPGAVVLASSPTAPYELWCYGNNVFASQFHLEFDEPLVIDKIWTRLTDIGRLNSEQSVASRKALEGGGQHNVQMLQVC